MHRILVVGSKGQLGSTLKELAKNTNYIWHYATREDMNIANRDKVFEVFDTLNPSICINCAAYTLVDKAEDDIHQSKSSNIIGVTNLSLACRDSNCLLIHISTDFVFDGKSSVPYLEEFDCNPINVYGETKLQGEKMVTNIIPKSIIIRTSWLYSHLGSNFVKSIISVAKKKKECNVVSDQVGSPTYCEDLVLIIVTVIDRFLKMITNYLMEFIIIVMRELQVGMILPILY